MGFSRVGGLCNLYFFCSGGEMMINDECFATLARCDESV